MIARYLDELRLALTVGGRQARRLLRELTAAPILVSGEALAVVVAFAALGGGLGLRPPLRRRRAA